MTKVLSISSSPKNLYFVRVRNVIFNKGESYTRMLGCVKTTNGGARYVEDNQISDALKIKFMYNPTIKEFAKDKEIFIFFQELENEKLRNGFLSYADISWADYSKLSVIIKRVMGTSNVSQNDATNIMLENLKNKNFERAIFGGAAKVIPLKPLKQKSILSKLLNKLKTLIKF